MNEPCPRVKRIKLQRRLEKFSSLDELITFWTKAFRLHFGNRRTNKWVQVRRVELAGPTKCLSCGPILRLLQQRDAVVVPASGLRLSTWAVFFDCHIFGW